MSIINFDYVNRNEKISPDKFNKNFQVLEETINSGAIAGVTTTNAYGLEWDVTNARFTRLGSAFGKTKGADFDAFYPWSGMRRCNMTNDGHVRAYYGQANYREDGTNGQVMVEIPKFYYRSIATEYTMNNGKVVPSKVQYWISDGPAAGYRLHPAFSRGGIERDYIYLGAYEATLYDVSASTYAGDFAFDSTADMLASVVGFQPVSGKHSTFTRRIARQMAQRRGAGWEIQDFFASSAVQMLLLIEIGNFDSQTEIGQGVVSVSDNPNTDNHSIVTGGTSNLGNASGEASGTAGQRSVSYRGIENFWGNIWIWIDGINIKNIDGVSHAWVADHGFTDDTSDAPYHMIDYPLCNANGYVDTLIFSTEDGYAFLPATALGASNKPVNDYYYQSIGTSGTNWRVARLGARWDGGSRAGAFCWLLDSSSGSSARHFGSRLGFYGEAIRDAA